MVVPVVVVILELPPPRYVGLGVGEGVGKSVGLCVGLLGAEVGYPSMYAAIPLVEQLGYTPSSNGKLAGP